jgi:hypothetical protein
MLVGPPGNFPAFPCVKTALPLRFTEVRPYSPTYMFNFIDNIHNAAKTAMLKREIKSCLSKA